MAVETEQTNTVPQKKHATFKEFMKEQRIVNRWFILSIAIFGAFCGSLLAVAFMVTFGLGWP